MFFKLYANNFENIFRKSREKMSLINVDKINLTS